MQLKKGEVVSIASGVWEGYGRTGPFVVARDFDLEAFIDKVRATIDEDWKVSGLMYEIPRMLLAQGFISKFPCRRVFLGAWNEFDLGEESEDL